MSASINLHNVSGAEATLIGEPDQRVSVLRLRCDGADVSIFLPGKAHPNVQVIASVFNAAFGKPNGGDA